MANFKNPRAWGKAQLKKLDELNRGIVLRIAADTAQAFQVTRIFEDGKNSQNSKLGSYSDSYIKVRKKKGRETSFVNLRFSGNLQLDYSNGDKTTKIGKTQVSQVKRNRNVELIPQLEKRYGKIFALTAKEQQKFVETLQDETFLLLNA